MLCLICANINAMSLSYYHRPIGPLPLIRIQTYIWRSNDIGIKYSKYVCK